MFDELATVAELYTLRNRFRHMKHTACSDIVFDTEVFNNFIFGVTKSTVRITENDWTIELFIGPESYYFKGESLFSAIITSIQMYSNCRISIDSIQEAALQNTTDLP